MDNSIRTPKQRTELDGFCSRLGDSAQDSSLVDFEAVYTVRETMCIERSDKQNNGGIQSGREKKA